MSIKIQNVVAKVSFGGELDPKELLDRLGTSYDVQYKPAMFPGVIVKEGPNTPTFLLFRSGKGVCIGAKNASECVKAAEKLHKQLVEHGLIMDENFTVEIQNVVASADFGFPIDVEKVADSLERVIYEPEQFPAAIYYMERPRVAMLIFSSGKTIIAGAKSEEEVVEAYRKMLTVLGQFREQEEVV
jgi:transcription initiation factor TFIID TATA-box-binding protein